MNSHCRRKRTRRGKNKEKGSVDPGMEGTEDKSPTIHYEGAENNEEHYECENNDDLGTENFSGRKCLSPSIRLHDCIVPDSEDEN